MKFPGISFSLPDWLTDFLAKSEEIVFPSASQRMECVVGLASGNIEHGTGGPFGAGVFDKDGRLIAPGVNLVVSGNCSILHAEIVAIILTQQKLGRYDIGDGGKYRYELVTSTEPCAMCFGAIPWSGVSSVVCGARDEDARRIGFDEGPKPEDWAAALNVRGIQVTKDILRQQAVAVLESYSNMGGALYNSGPNDAIHS
jgi:tRNA(Arg) A34 adenosine deaminase TadA